VMRDDLRFRQVFALFRKANTRYNACLGRL
jgi:hypothetical protein